MTNKNSKCSDQLLAKTNLWIRSLNRIIGSQKERHVVKKNSNIFSSVGSTLIAFDLNLVRDKLTLLFDLGPGDISWIPPHRLRGRFVRTSTRASRVPPFTKGVPSVY